MRGLKSGVFFSLVDLAVVASLADAWIEIPVTTQVQNLFNVASLADAWIEIIC